MKKIVSILFVGVFAAGCASSRYDVRVAPVPVSQARADWVVVRIDRQTGQAWYSYNQNVPYPDGNLKPEWHPILEGVQPPQK
jgi:hypothetical protein